MTFSNLDAEGAPGPSHLGTGDITNLTLPKHSVFLSERSGVEGPVVAVVVVFSPHDQNARAKSHHLIR